MIFTDSSEDILAKYRTKVTVGGETAKSECAVKHSEDGINETRDISDDERLVIDPNHIEASYAFADAKKKLRLVLSTADMQQVPDGIPSTVSIML